MMLSLQKICLNIIVDNFDRYHSAYTTAKSFSLKSTFELLQRKYSCELAQALHKKRTLHKKYVDFVINRYLKFLHTYWLNECEWEVVKKKFSEIGPGLEKVYFDRSHPWEDVIRHLCNILKVVFENCSDLCLISIAKFCPKIHSIVFDMTNISSIGLYLLCCKVGGAYPCPDLREIIIHRYPSGKEAEIAYLLEKLPTLENLECRNLPQMLYVMHEDSMHASRSMKPYNLTSFHLDLDPDSSNFNDILKFCVIMCPKLQSLNIIVSTEEQLNLCSQFPMLKELFLEYSGPDEYLDINNFLKLKGNKLTFLKVKNVSFFTATLLTNCSMLSVLSLNAFYILHYENHEFPVTHNLKEVSIKNFDGFDSICTKEVACFLSSCPNLERLKINNREVDDCILSHPEIQAAVLRCCESGKLQNVNFSWSELSFEFVQDVLSACTSLKTLNIIFSDLSRELVLMERLIEFVRKLPNKPVIYYRSKDYEDYGPLF